MKESSRTIKALRVEAMNIPLWESFGISGGSQSSAKNLLVTVELADGTRGYGEAAPLRPFNGETQEMAFSAIKAAKVLLEGADIRQWRPLSLKLREATKGIGSAQCALETAILDAFTRQSQMPMWAFFGGSSSRIETDMTVPIPTVSTEDELVEHTANFTRYITDNGITTIKIKIGEDPANDIKRIQTVHATAPNASIILDGNAGYATAEAALNIIDLLRQKDIVPILFEQPVPKDDLEGLRSVTQRAGIPVAADESAHDLNSVRRILEREAATVVNVKLMKFGVIEAWDIVSLCRSAGVGLMIGGMVESPLAMTMSACFAGGIGGFTYFDLDTPFFMESIPLKGSCYLKGDLTGSGRVSPTPFLDLTEIAEGHGISPC